MSRTISSSTTGPVVLGTADNPLSITSTGTVTSTGSGADGIDGGSGTTWTISNAGKISSANNTGISLGGSGVVTSSGSISGADAVDLRAGGNVTNLSGGSISSTGSSGAGVFITGAVGTLTNSGGISAVKFGVLVSAGGSVSNTQSGTITAGDIGVFLQNQAGTVTNAGFISGTGTQGTGVYLENNGNVTNTSTGTITGQKFGTFIEGGFGTLANYGSISGAAYDGVILGLGGVITNAAGASISSVNNGIYVKYRASGTVTNSGAVSASGTGGAGIDLADGGVVTNNSTGTISGNAFGVFITGAAGAVTNKGSISAPKYDGVVLAKGGSVTNVAGASITGGSNGVYIESGSSGTITNSGNIKGTGSSSAGIDLGSGGSVTNNSGGSITGGGFGVFSTGALGSVANSGNISGTHGVGLEAGGSLTNNASGSITGQSVGVFSQGAAATLVNAGLITATSGTAADIEGGGSITNQAGATLSGSSFGVFITGGASTVTNAGTISGGSYAIDFAGSGTNRLIVDPGAVFTGKIAVSGSTNTLELASGTGTLSGIGTGSFNNFQTLVADAGGVWTLSGANTAPTLIDNGTLSLTGSLDATSALDPSSTGLFQLQTGASLEVAAATGAKTQVNFVGNSELIVDNVASFGSNVGSASYAGTQLQSFGSGDKIDLKNFSSAGVTLSYNASTGVLQLSNGSQTADLAFQASTLGSTAFQAASDGASGTFITTAASPPPPPPGPTVSSITTSGTGISNGTGDLNAGKIVTFTVSFSEAVNVTGSPLLALNDGGNASYASGSGTSALTFTYTVAANQNTPDLTVSSLSLNGGTIQDAASNNANLSGANNYQPPGVLQIDTTAPVVTIANTGGTVTQATQIVTGTVDAADAGTTVTVLDGTTQVGTTTVPASGTWTSNVTLTSGANTLTAQDTDAAGNTGTSNAVTYTLNSTVPVVSSITASGTGISNGTGDLNAGKIVTFTVSFSEAVNVTGSPLLALNDGGNASYASGSGTSALTFTYTVAANQNTPDLTVSSLSLNGGTIQDAASNNANLSGANNYQPPGVLQIDTTAPVVTIANTGGTVTQATQIVTGTVDAADAGTTVTVLDGTTQVGTTTVPASGTWTSNVTLTSGANTLTAQDTDAAGNTGTSNAVTYTLNSTVPVVSSITASGTGISNGTGDLNAGKIVTFTVSFSEAVNVTGSPLLALNDGGNASYASGSGTSALTFTYTVAANQNTPDLTVSSLSLNGGTIQDAASNNANLSGANNYQPPGVLQIDTTAPVVTIANTGGTVTQATQIVTGTVDAADAGTTVTVLDGTTQVGTTTVPASGTWTSNVTLTSGANTLTAQDTDAAGNTGTSNAVTYTLNSTVPVVSSITASGTGISNGTGDLNAGKIVTFTVSFSEAVNVTGSPLLALNDGGNASYASGSGTSALTFTYTVAANQNTPDLTVSSLSLNGGTIQDAASNNANLSGANNYQPPGVLQIDTTAPVVTIANTGGTVTQATQIVTGTVDAADAGTTVTVLDGTTQVGTTTVPASGTWTSNVTLTSGANTLTAQDTDAAGNTGTSNAVTYTLNSTVPVVSSITASGTGISNGTGDLNAGKIVTFTVSFSEAVNVTGSPLLALNDGGNASYASGSGTSALTFTYTVAANQNTPDLTVSSLSLNGGTIQDAASNNANLSGANNYQPPGVLQIDTTAPVVTIANTGGTVTQATQIVTGTVDAADAGTTVTVLDGTTQVGTTTVPASGTWTSNVTLTSGANTLTAQDTDAAGNTGTSNAVTYTLASPPPPPPAGSTISTSTVGPLVLSAASNPLYITSTGAVTSTGSGTNGVNGGTGTAWSITNAGKIASSGGDGVSLATGSTINNKGTLSGVEAVVLRAGGTVTNAANASISSSGNGAGVYIAGAAGTVTNAGAVSAVYHGVFMAAGGSVSNAATGSISGQHNGVLFKAQAGTVTNSGNISGTGSGGTGVYLQNNGAVTNTSTGTITGHQFGAFIEGGFANIANYGSISGASYDGIVLGLGGVVTNAAGASISGGSNGVYAKYRAAGTVTNSGHIGGTASGSTGVDLADGGSLTNSASGSIAGSSFGVFLGGAAATVTNAGTISGGSYAVDFTGSATNRLILDPGAVFVGSVTANSSGSNTLELAGGSGAGSTGGVGTAFKHFQTLAVDGGATWTLTGSNTVATVLENGTLNIAGSLVVSNAINPASTGLFQLQAGAKLETAADTGTKTQINFLGSSQLVIDNVSSFGTNVGTSSYTGPLLEHFVNGDKVDLKHFSSTGVSFSYNSSTGVLQLSNGSSQHASLDFQTSSLGSASFQLSSDGAGGTFVTTALDSDGSPEPPALAIAKTSLTVAAGGSISLGVTATPADSDDAVSVNISGVPSYETISAPSGDTVAHQAGSSTWTITSTAGVSITGLTLNSNYTGTGHPVAPLSVTASNKTAGETASSASQIINVTDPPAVTSAAGSSSTTSTAVVHLAALLDQFVAAGFQKDHSSVGQLASLAPLQGGQEGSPFLAHPHH